MSGQRLQQRAPKLAEALARGGFQKNLARRCAIAAITFGFLVTAAAGLGLADYHWVFPRWLRLAGGGLMLAAVVAGILWLRREWNRFSSARRVALELERRHPDLGCVLSTAVEYAETDQLTQSDNPYEKVLVERLMQTAARQSVAARPDLWTELRRALPIVIGAGLAGGLLLGLVPDLPVVLRRVMTPWEPVGYTLLDIVPGTTDWPAEEPVEIRASFRGPVTTAPKISWKTVHEPKRTAWMKRAGPSEFVFSFPKIQDPTDYTIEVARLEPVSHRITPVSIPVLQEVEVRVTPPDYTGLPVLHSHNLSMSLLSGSRVAVSFTVDRPLAKVALQFEDGEQLPMVQSKEKTWLAHWFPAQTTTYRLAFTEADGRTLLSPRPYPLVVIPDQPPRLRWEAPLPDRSLWIGNPVTLNLSIQDDYGPVAARFFWKKAGEPARASTLALQEVGPGAWWANPVLRLPEGTIQPGDLILTWVESSDARHRTADTVAKSRPLAFVCLLPSSPPATGQEPETATNLETIPSVGADSEFLKTSWFELAWVVHSGIFGLSPSTPREAVADLQAEVHSLSTWLSIWLKTWDQMEPDESAHTAAVRQALDNLEATLKGEDRKAWVLASEKVLAAIASLLFHANREAAEQVSQSAQTYVLKEVSAREKEWLDAADRWSGELKSTARQMSELNQRMAGSQRIMNLTGQLKEAKSQITRIINDMSGLAQTNPFCGHQLLKPVQAAATAVELAVASAQQGEPGQAVRDSTRAVRELMKASESLDDEREPGQRLNFDGARELPGDPLEMVLDLYFRRVTEGETAEGVMP